MSQAQRVKAAQRPKGGALTQRREYHPRCPCVGKLGADLPSGAPRKKWCDAACTLPTAKRLRIGMDMEHLFRRTFMNAPGV
jgi:hypothetical protein